MGGAASNESDVRVRAMEVAPGEIAYFVARRDLPLTHTPEQRPPTQPWLPPLANDDPVHFVFERLSPATIEFWGRYAKFQYQKVERMHQAPIEGGLIAFQETIDVYNKGCGGSYDMWVAYVTNGEPTALSAREALVPRANVSDRMVLDASQIEMVVTVLVDRTAPFTSHSGIFRTERYWIRKARVGGLDIKATPFGHARLSLHVHQFAALMSRKLYRHMRVHNSFMVTKPEDKMGEILRESGLVAGRDFIAGSPKERESGKCPFYMPPLGQPLVPFVTETSGGVWDTTTATHHAPAWMERGECGHGFLAPAKRQIDVVTHTVRLSSLARMWPTRPRSNLRFGGQRKYAHVLS
jgi:hypothetical protein